MDHFGGLFELKRGIVSQYVRKVSIPKLETIQKICLHYKITIDDFVNTDLTINSYINYKGEFCIVANLIRNRKL